MHTNIRIETAFRRLPLLSGVEILLKSAVNLLSNIDGTGTGAVTPKFSIVSRRRTKRELEKLAHPQSDLSACFDALHEPAILALAAHGFCRELGPLPEKLREIANRASRSDLKWAPEVFAGGRPKNHRAHAVGILLAYYYEMLTGKEPTRIVNAYVDSDAPCGPFIDFVRDIFDIIGLKASVEDIARMAIKRRQELKE